MTSLCAFFPNEPDDSKDDGCWHSQHIRFVSQAKETEPDVLLIGDSILQNFQFSTIYKTCIEPLHTLNFSIYDDQTQNVLWRVLNGELDGLGLKVIVLMIGTHNTHTAKEICDGVIAIVNIIKLKQNLAHIIIMGLLPCGRGPNRRRSKHKEVNKLLASEFPSSNRCTFLCPDWDQFVQPNGGISHRDMFDYMHPTDNGYTKFAEPLLEELQRSLQTFLKTNAPSSIQLE